MRCKSTGKVLIPINHCNLALSELLSGDGSFLCGNRESPSGASHRSIAEPQRPPP